MTAPAYVLLHSLLLGPLTWAPVAAALTSRGATAIVPSLTTVTDPDHPPFWPRVIAEVGAAVDRLPPGGPVVLVAHSNAGLLVPSLVQASAHPVAGCVFVDADLPSGTGSSAASTPGRLARLRTMATGGRLPRWTEWWDEAEVATHLRTLTHSWT
ncbi:hypothetical protein [Actinoplanes sp. NPDC051851]|uniref:hypothetical protein n=1 Tax=Actinoplanes sp. NPDC051851 TaxID=3154753 RepID=UPI00342F10D1